MGLVSDTHLYARVPHTVHATRGKRSHSNLTARFNCNSMWNFLNISGGSGGRHDNAAVGAGIHFNPPPYGMPNFPKIRHFAFDVSCDCSGHHHSQRSLDERSDETIGRRPTFDRITEDEVKITGTAITHLRRRRNRGGAEEPLMCSRTICCKSLICSGTICCRSLVCFRTICCRYLMYWAIP